MAQEDVFKKIVSHCKEYGFVFPSSEIYDGLGAVYGYGQNGVELKNNIKEYWWKSMVLLHENIVGIAPPVSCGDREDHHHGVSRSPQGIGVHIPLLRHGTRTVC